MRAIITCVGYDDFLRITLPRTMGLLDAVTVLTTPDDANTLRVANNAWIDTRLDHRLAIQRTNAFHEDNAPLNKGKALDAAIKATDPGWICVLDADILLPEKMDLSGIEREHLYSPHRRMLEDPGPIPPEEEWDALDPGPERRNGEYAGYCHIFHTDDLGKPPWYETPLFNTAQGCDTVFTYSHWGPRTLRRLPFEVLHLGPRRVNWSGRVSERWDEQSTR